MAKDDEIDDQVKADWEFTRRAQELISKLRTKGTAGPSAADGDSENADRNREEAGRNRPEGETPPKHNK
jgi:hypothetical protein